MFFLLSKAFWFVVAPSHSPIILIGLGYAAWRRGKKCGPRLVASGCALALLFVFSPFGALALRPLEDRFPRLPQQMEPPTGIIVLGGSVDEVVTSARHQTTLDEAAERLTEAVALARLYPQAKLVFTGGSASLLGGDFTESDVVRQFWREMGVDETRVVFEDKSRNTFENAIFTRELVHPRKNERWLLITSAFHMPRAVGIFRRAGMTLIPYPVDYRTTGTAHDFRISPDGPLALRLSELALREWIGLFAYWASGKTDSLFPGPETEG